MRNVPMQPRETRLSIQNEMDVARATLQAVSFCEALGFERNHGQMLATAVSELARNVIKYAVRGDVIMRPIAAAKGKGVEVVVSDEGPGIADLQLAIRDHYSTGGTLGLGLPGVKRMMDEFEIESELGRGTRITIRKWL